MKFDAVELADADLRTVCGGMGATVGDPNLGLNSSSQSQGGLLDVLAATVDAVANLNLDNASSGIGSLGSTKGDTTSTRNSGD